MAGSKAAQRLIEEGFIVTAWNRDASKAEALKKAGVESNENLVEAVGEADVALLLLADASAIDSVLLADEAVLKALKGRTVLQMGTIGTHTIRCVQKAFVAVWMHLLLWYSLCAAPHVNNVYAQQTYMSGFLLVQASTPSMSIIQTPQEAAALFQVHVRGARPLMPITAKFCRGSSKVCRSRPPRAAWPGTVVRLAIFQAKPVVVLGH